MLLLLLLSLLLVPTGLKSVVRWRGKQDRTGARRKLCLRQAHPARQVCHLVCRYNGLVAVWHCLYAEGGGGAYRAVLSFVSAPSTSCGDAVTGAVCMWCRW